MTIIFYLLLVLWSAKACETGKCNSSSLGCVDSAFGVRCLECSLSGYLENAKCVCYSNNLNPSTACALTEPDFPPFTTQEIEIVHDRKYCTSYADAKNGYYETIYPDQHRFGSVDPPVPKKCFGFVYGPPPGQLVESEVLPQEDFEECTMFGGFDPNELSTALGFRECNGHGTWNKTSVSCECDLGWKLEIIGKDYFDADAYSCVACDYHFGPSLDYQQASPPFCTSIHSPNPINGKFEECGGRGHFVNGGCSCFSNSTIGYWALGTIGGVFDDNNQEVFAESCILCQEGYHTYPYCL